MDNFAILSNVTHIYQDLKSETLAVSDLSLSVKKGEFVALVGPSGCGKTTLLSIISGMIKPTEGSVTISGREADVTNVGYMLQHDHLLEWQTIRSNTLLGLRVRHMLNKETEAYADDLLNRYGLSDFKEAYPSQLSGGMRQKAALIRTLVLKPEMLLLDEPFSALDFQTRLTLADEVMRIIRLEEKTAILVTHDISEAVSLADKVVVLTKRPACIKAMHNIELSGSTSLEKRTDTSFAEYFDMVWNELNS